MPGIYMHIKNRVPDSVRILLFTCIIRVDKLQWAGKMFRPQARHSIVIVSTPKSSQYDQKMVNLA